MRNSHYYYNVFVYIILLLQFDINKALRVDEARVVELEKEASECSLYKEEIEQANAKIKELEEKLQEAIERTTTAEENGAKEVTLLKQTHEERENSLLERIRKLETELESLKIQHQLDIEGNQ